jgi:hypothetical protein
MKIIKIAITSIISLIFCFTILFYYRPSTLSVLAKIITEHILSTKQIKVEIDDLRIDKLDNKNVIYLNKVILKNSDKDLIAFNNVEILLDLDALFHSLQILLKINIDSFEIIETKTNFNIDAFVISYSTDLKNHSNKLDFKIKFNNANQITENIIYNTDIRCLYDDIYNKKTINNCSIFINNNSSIIIKNASFDGDLIKIDGAVKAIPIDFYKIFENIYPNNASIAFMKKGEMTGEIVNGEFNVNIYLSKLKDGITKDNISGKLNIKNLFFVYNSSYPPLKNIDSTLSIEGDMVNMVINSGYMNNTKLDGSIIKILWNDIEENKVLIDGIAKGPPSDLTSFISPKLLEKLKKSFIDLKSIKGEAETKIDIIIPIKARMKNTYAVSTKVSNMSMNLLKYLNLSKGELSGKFDGNFLNLQSSGILNNCPYKMSEQFDIEKGNNLLSMDLTISKKLNVYDLIKINSGSANLNFKHISDSGKENMSLSSDLSTLEFSILYPSINKSPDSPMELLIQAGYKNDTIDSFNVSITNNRNTNIKGKVIITDSGFIYNFKEIKSADNDFEIIFKNTNKMNDISIIGKKIDLSNINLDFFIPTQGQAKKDIIIKAKLANAKMQNNVELTNVKIDVSCKNNLCEAGQKIYGQFNDKDVKLDLSYSDQKEIWDFSSADASSFFKSLNIFDKIEGGYLKVHFEKDLAGTNPKGAFSMQNFSFIDAPSVTKIISIGSLSGFLSTLGNDKKISFTKFEGQFKKKTENLWQIYYTKCDGNFFDFILNSGEVDTKLRSVKISYLVVPHYYFGSLIQPIPVIKDLSLAIRSGFSKLNPLMTFTKEFKY